MKTFMFPGQGSQKKGMGGDLFDRFAELTAKADAVLGYSIKTLCLEDPDKVLGETQFTQPALYVVNALSYYAHIEDGGDKPDFVAGHSLGEYNALLAAEVFDFEAGLKLVKRRGELMSEASGGGMAAIMNTPKEQIEQILADNGLTNIDLANFNTQEQIVISGLKEEVTNAKAFFQEGKMMFHPLNTSGAFHSRFMEPSRKKFLTYVKKFKMQGPKIPVIANVTAREYGDDIAETLAGQISSSVKWFDSVQHLIFDKGSDDSPMEFIEFGHGNVLTKMVKKIERELGLNKKKAAASKPAAKAEAPEATDNQQPSKAAPAKAASTKAGQNALALVNEWNEKHKVGTQAKSLTIEYDALTTRTEAMVLFGHRAAVYMEGYSGYFDLREISAA